MRQETRAGRSLKPYSMTNRGLQIELSLCQPKEPGGFQLAILDCASKDFSSQNIAIYLRSISNDGDYHGDRPTPAEGVFLRTSCHELEFLEDKI